MLHRSAQLFDDLANAVQGPLQLFDMAFIEGAQYPLHLRRGDAAGPRQVDDVDLVLQVVELSAPVFTDTKDIDVVLLDVLAFLLPVFLRDRQVNVADGLHDLDLLLKGDDRLLALDRVEVIGRNTDDQPIPELTQAPEDVQMTNMEQVERPVCEDCLAHAYTSNLELTFNLPVKSLG